MSGLRPTPAGAAGAAVALAAGGLWLLTGDAARHRLPVLAWFLLVAGAGLFLPGIANQLTISRAYLAAAGFIYALAPSGLGALAVTVALAGLTDLTDGTVARRFEQPSRLGGALDPVVDGLFFGAVAAGLAASGAYPPWLAGLVILRYLLPALVGGGLLLAGRRPVLRHTLLGQVSTTLIAILMGGLALFRGLGQDASTLLAAGEVVIPLATLATFANLTWVNRGAIRGWGPQPSG